MDAERVDFHLSISPIETRAPWSCRRVAVRLAGTRSSRLPMGAIEPWVLQQPRRSTDPHTRSTPELARESAHAGPARKKGRAGAHNAQAGSRKAGEAATRVVHGREHSITVYC